VATAAIGQLPLRSARPAVPTLDGQGPLPLRSPRSLSPQTCRLVSSPSQHSLEDIHSLVQVPICEFDGNTTSRHSVSRHSSASALHTSSGAIVPTIQPGSLRLPGPGQAGASVAGVAVPACYPPVSARAVPMRSLSRASSPDLAGGCSLRGATGSWPTDMQSKRSKPPASGATCMIPGGVESNSTKASFMEAPSLASDTTEDHRPTPEDYQRLLDQLVTQERNKAELADRLAQSEEDLKQRLSENEELRSALQQFQGGTVQAAHLEPRLPMEGVHAVDGSAGALPSPGCSGIGSSGMSGNHDLASPGQWPESFTPTPRRIDTPSPRRSPAGSGPTRRLPWSPPRTPKGPKLALQYAVSKERIEDKYAVNWAERLHVGTTNSLGSPPTKTGISCFFKAKAKGNGGLRSVKVVHKQHIPYPRLFQQQLSDMFHLDHPNIVNLHDVYEDDHHVFLIYDYLCGPSLLEKAIGDPQFCERDAASVIKAVLQVLAYLHERNITHLNLHPENFRYLVSPKRKGSSGSSYSDQLKLFDFGLALEIRCLSSDLQAVEVPEGQHLPVLPSIGAQASMGDRCLAPEFRGADGKDLGSFLSGGFGSGGLSPSRSRSNSPSRSLAARSIQEDPVSRQVRDAFTLLEASDTWSAGCLLHLLLTGQLPGDCAHGRKVQQSSSALDNVSSDARELCKALLQQDPWQRRAAAEAMNSDWIRRCDSLLRIHRSQSKGLGVTIASATTPMTEQVRARLARHFAASRLRKLVLAVQTLRRSPRSCSLIGAESDEGEGPPPLLGAGTAEGPGSAEAAGIRATVAVMCYEAYQAIATARPAGAATGVLHADLAEAVEKAVDLPWKDPQGVFKRTCPALRNKASVILPASFAEFVWTACCGALA